MQFAIWSTNYYLVTQYKLEHSHKLDILLVQLVVTFCSDFAYKSNTNWQLKIVEKVTAAERNWYLVTQYKKYHHSLGRYTKLLLAD